MIKKLTLLLILLLSTGVNAMSTQQYSEAISYLSDDITDRIVITQDGGRFWFIQADATSIYISKEAIEELQSPEELRLCVLHELSHINHDDYYAYRRDRNTERRADREAEELMAAAGEDPEKVCRFFKIRYSPQSDSHPSSKERYENCIQIMVQ